MKYSINTISIIGNESYTPYSERLTTNVSLHLIKANYALVSGLSKGIESLANHQFNSGDGYKIAFVAHGLDVCYPAYNKHIISKIIQNGAVISEHPLGTKPIKAFFIKKNALVASWSNKVLLIEANKTANALGIIKIAKKLLKPIFVAPHELYKAHAEGSNKVICNGGLLYINAFQLTPDYITKVSPQIIPPSTINSDEELVLQALKSKEKSVNELAFDLNLPLLKIVEIITILELESLVIQLPGTKYKCLEN